MTQFYLNPSDERAPHTLPNVWVTHMSAGEWYTCPSCDEKRETETCDCARRRNSDSDKLIAPQTCEPNGEGFYYCFCLPGCMPDSEWDGPYETEDKAIEACRNLHGDCE